MASRRSGQTLCRIISHQFSRARAKWKQDSGENLSRLLAWPHAIILSLDKAGESNLKLEPVRATLTFVGLIKLS